MIVFLLQLAGAAALLLWSVRLIRTGVERAYSNLLRSWLRHSADHRLSGAASGAVAAVMLQSSTAVAMLAAGFAASGGLALAPGLAILLGADLGSAVVAQILLVRASWLVPLLLLVGIALFLRAPGRRARQFGRILTGLGLILTSLDMLRAATEPLRDSPLVAMTASYLGNDPVAAFVLGTALAWGLHSSVAGVLLFVTFAAEGLIGAPAAVALVLGANLGGAAVPVGLTWAGPVAARRLALGNLLLRGGGAFLALGLVARADGLLGWLGDDAARQAINLHLAFNFAVLLAGLPLCRAAARAAEMLLPAAAAPSAGMERVSALNPAALDDPERALACSARELLRLGEEIESMLAPVFSLYSAWDEAMARTIMEKEAEVDRIHFETKLYLARLHEVALSSAQTRRTMDLVTIAINLEAAGDVISDSLLGMARRIHKEGLSFSEEGLRELGDFHDRVLANAQLALDVLIMGDPDNARRLVAEKEQVRVVEQELQQRHLERLRRSGGESIATSNIHQETLRALKQINTAFSFVAYPIAEESGELRQTRLRKSKT